MTSDTKEKQQSKIARATRTKRISSTGKAKPKAQKSSTKKVMLNDEMVCQYLSQNPNFFIRNAKQIENIQIPHPVRGVISLPEWQLARQRNKIKQLESEITLLLEYAAVNEKLFESLMSLFAQLLSATSLNELSKNLNDWAKSLGLVGAYFYLFDNKWQLGSPFHYQQYKLNAERFEFIRLRHLQYTFQYLGQLNPTELSVLIPKSNNYVGSVALSLLGQFGDLGVLVFASHHAQHYQQGQGTLLLEKISEILPILIERWVIRK